MKKFFPFWKSRFGTALIISLVLILVSTSTLVFSDAIQQQNGIACIDTNKIWKWLRAYPTSTTSIPQSTTDFGCIALSLSFISGGGEGSFHPALSISAAGGNDGTSVPSTGLVVQDANSTYQIVPSVGNLEAVPDQGELNVPAIGPSLYNGLPSAGGTQWHPQRETSATNLTATTTVGVPLVAQLSTWSVTHSPATNTQATASKAAGGGTVRHVATGITACFVNTNVTAGGGAVNLRDGASGAGTIKWTAYIGATAAPQDNKCISLPITIIGTANSAMTLEFSGAGGADTFETVTLTGYSVP